MNRIDPVKIARSTPAVSKAWKAVCRFFGRLIARADEAVDFFVHIAAEWFAAADRAFFPGKGKRAAGLAGCVVCCVVLLAAFIAEPFLMTEVVPVQAPVQAQATSAPEEPFDIDQLVSEYQLKLDAAAAAAPATVSVTEAEMAPLTLDSLEYTQPSAGWTIDLSNLSGGGAQQAAYLHNNLNDDVIGWLQIPGTNINYPVMQGTSLYTYMNADIYGNYSYNGSIWVDTDVTDYSTNTVMFGHNWTNVSGNPSVGRSSDVMFAQLPSYAHSWFAQQAPYIYYSTTSRDMVWQVFAAFYTTDLNFYLYTNYTGQRLQSIIDKGKSLSLHNFGVSVSSSDRIITLSTCTRALGPSENQRFVVMAKLVG